MSWIQRKSNYYWATDGTVTYNAADETWTLLADTSQSLYARKTYENWVENYRPAKLKISFTGGDVLLCSLTQGPYYTTSIASDYIKSGEAIEISFDTPVDNIHRINFSPFPGDNVIITNISFSEDSFEGEIESESWDIDVETIRVKDDAGAYVGTINDFAVAARNGIPYLAAYVAADPDPYGNALKRENGSWVAASELEESWRSCVKDAI